MAASSKRITLTLAEKVKIIDLVEKGGIKKCDIARQFNIPANSLSTIIKNKANLKRKFSDGSTSTDRKRIREGNYAEIEAALLKWFTRIRAKNIPVTGPLLKEKATDFAKLLGKEDFVPSNGWLQRFKDRHAIVFKMTCGESGSVDEASIKEWLVASQQLISQYKDCDVYNADETGLFFQLVPQKTLAFKGETCSGGKNSKIRLTVMVCANKDGSDKRKLLVIGKSRNPRCFKKGEISKLSVTYRANKKAWINSDIFSDWLKEFDSEMSRKNRKVLLLVDNCTAHATNVVLKAVTLHRLPPNTTSKLQPMDQGIIRNLKVFYRKRLLRKIILDSEKGKETKIDVKMACEMLSSAWDEVLGKTIERCWKHAGFGEMLSENYETEPTSTDEIDLEKAWNHIKEQRIIETDDEFEDFVNIDNELCVEAEMTDEEIINEVQQKNEASSDEECEEIPTEKKVSAKVAIESLENLKTYFSSANISSATLDEVEELLTTSIVSSSKQTAIDSFFKPV